MLLDDYHIVQDPERQAGTVVRVPWARFTTSREYTIPERARRSRFWRQRSPWRNRVRRLRYRHPRRGYAQTIERELRAGPNRGLYMLEMNGCPTVWVAEEQRRVYLRGPRNDGRLFFANYPYMRGWM